jgi:hypothetical protein
VRGCSAVDQGLQSDRKALFQRLTGLMDAQPVWSFPMLHDSIEPALRGELDAVLQRVAYAFRDGASVCP